MRKTILTAVASWLIMMGVLIVFMAWFQGTFDAHLWSIDGCAIFIIFTLAITMFCENERKKI